jgi:hypothetical protein
LKKNPFTKRGCQSDSSGKRICLASMRLEFKTPVLPKKKKKKKKEKNLLK